MTFGRLRSFRFATCDSAGDLKGGKENGCEGTRQDKTAAHSTLYLMTVSGAIDSFVLYYKPIAVLHDICIAEVAVGPLQALSVDAIINHRFMFDSASIKLV